jgi:lipopolysaccharide transport system ATP-binding protein
MLKVLSRITEPTEGRVEVFGRVNSLLEVGTGFHPELSGRENVFLNGAILGHSRRDMQRRFDAIVDFSELEHFIDAPLRTYSTGMVARLGFAIATDMEPEILVVDEVLSVGDIEFQRKCTERIERILRSGTTLVLVSHSPESVLQLCGHALWLAEGGVVADGPAREVVDAFVARPATTLSAAG